MSRINKKVTQVEDIDRVIFDQHQVRHARAPKYCDVRLWWSAVIEQNAGATCIAKVAGDSQRTSWRTHRKSLLRAPEWRRVMENAEVTPTDTARSALPPAALSTERVVISADWHEAGVVAASSGSLG